MSTDDDDEDVGSLAEAFDGFWFEEAQNGLNCWTEERLRTFLDYRNKRAFTAVVHRAMKALLSYGRDPTGEILRQPDGTYKFTRTGCFAVALSASDNKPRVVQMRTYLLLIADFTRHGEIGEAFARVLARDEVTETVKGLSQLAKERGVKSFGHFADEGYRGLYNLPLADIERKKGVVHGQLLDRMGSTELAANLFRLTQTKDRIERSEVRGQDDLNATAFKVGARVREMMVEDGGTPPEDLPVAEHISDARKRLRASTKKLEEYDATTAKYSRMLNTVDVIPDDAVEEEPGYTEDPEPTPDSDEVPF